MAVSEIGGNGGYPKTYPKHTQNYNCDRKNYDSKLGLKVQYSQTNPYANLNH